MAAEIATQMQDDQVRADAAEPAASAGVELAFPVRGLSFQSRIAVVALVTAVAVLTGACLLFMLQQWRTERAHFIQAQQALARIGAGDISEEFDRGDRGDALAVLRNLSSDPRLLRAELVAADGKVVRGFAQVGRPRVHDGSSVIDVRAPVDLGGGRTGALVLSVQPEGPGALLPRFLAMGGALFFVAAGVALFMG
ncbi:MAG TPA: hypothetical protein VIJ94_07845, partial [Caulobacteraceae bacterium]